MNYASDIDLLFLYSDDGLTRLAAPGGKLTNPEYFGKAGRIRLA